MNARKRTQTGIHFVSIESIDFHPRAERHRDDEKALETLGRSIEENDLLQPIILRPRPGGRYELLAGSRRLKASRRIGRTEIRADIRKASDAEALEIIGVENLLRRDLNPIERSEYICELLKKPDRGGAGMTEAAVGRRFGKSSSWVRNVKRTAAIPEPWRSRLISGELRETWARPLLPYLNKAPILKAIDAHQEKHPRDWQTREDWEANVAFVAGRFEEIEKSETIPEVPPGDLRELKALKPDPWTEERVDRQADQLRDALDERSADLLRDRADGLCDFTAGLTPESVVALLAPFERSAEDLRLIRDEADRRLSQLD